MLVLLYGAPLFLVFEVWQLVIAERYIGVKQLKAGSDPRELGLGEGTAFFWIATTVVYWLWMGLVFGGGIARAQIVTLFAVSIVGHLVRRNSRMKWTLVTLTFEGAIRIGMLISMTAVLYRAS